MGNGHDARPCHTDRMPPADPPPASERLAKQIARQAGQSRVSIACAESLTGGQIATILAAAPDSAAWFRGSLVAYSAQVKFEVLGVPPGPVVTEQCAATMAVGVRRLLGADVAVAVTGVGGPDDEEGKPAGTVWIAVAGPTAVCHGGTGADGENSAQQGKGGEGKVGDGKVGGHQNPTSARIVATRTELCRFDGDPAQVVAATAQRALELLTDALGAWPDGGTA